MPGTRAQPKNVVTVVAGYSLAAVTAGQILTEFVSTVFGRITGIKFYAGGTGFGVGNTISDVLVNGTSIWAIPVNRPTLNALSMGEFNNTIGSPGLVGLRPGDVVTLSIAEVFATTGHGRVMASVSIEGNA